MYEDNDIVTNVSQIVSDQIQTLKYVNVNAVY